MTRSRLLLNLLVGLVLAVILAGLVVVIVEHCERNIRPDSTFAQVDFEPGTHNIMNDRRKVK